MWIVVVIQWLHVLLGIFWFGSVLYTDFILIPAGVGMQLKDRLDVSKRISERSIRVIVPVATLVIILGVLRGTVWGPVHSLDFLFGTEYGITFFVGFLAAVATYLWGYFAVGGQARRLNERYLSVELNAKTAPQFEAAERGLKTAGLLELLGFLVVFTCMILMRFGL